MAITYSVNASKGLNIRSGPGTSYKKIGALLNKEVVSSDTQSNGWAHISHKGVSGYVSMQYLKALSTETPPTPASPPPNITGTTIPPNNAKTRMEGYADLNGGFASYDQYANFAAATVDKTHAQLFQRYLRALGCPPGFSKWVDLQYYDDIGSGVGRRMAETLFVNPSILSLCPGTVDYMPGFTSKEKDQFFNAVTAINKGDKLQNSTEGLSGKLYEFKSAYTHYINTVNLLCRAVAVYMNIGEEKIPGTNVSLKNYDYGYWSTASADGAAKESIFGETKRAINSIVTDDSYIHFFVSHQGTSYNETMDTSTTASDLETTFNSSNIHSLSRNLQFLFGGALDGSLLEKDVDVAINNAAGSSDFIAQFGKLAKNYLSGGRLVFPQMIDTVGYSKTLSATLKFVSPYGDPLSIFLRCYVPYLHLLAFTIPKQISENMYSFPYITRAFQRGCCNFDLSVISSLRLTKGGSDETQWTIKGLPTELEVTFDITPLYTNLMSSSTTQPFMFLQNTALAEYLATMCGVDMKANNIWKKLDLAKMALTGKVTDVPTNLARGIIDTKLVQGLSKFAKIVN